MHGTLLSVAPQKDKPVALFHLIALFMVESDPKVFAFPCWVSVARRVAGCGTSSTPSTGTRLSGEVSSGSSGGWTHWPLAHSGCDCNKPRFSRYGTFLLFPKARVPRDLLKIQVSGRREEKSDVLKLSPDVFCSHQLSQNWHWVRKEEAGYKPWLFPPGSSQELGALPSILRDNACGEFQLLVPSGNEVTPRRGEGL